MKKAQEQLLSLLSNSLFGLSTDVILTPEIIQEAKEHSVSALITTDYSIIASNVRVIKAHAELTKLLNGIEFTTFKGWASAFYYPQPIKRAMGDVDFITSSTHYAEVVQRLVNAGWERELKSHDRHESFRKNSVTLELHHEIKGIPNGVDGIETTSVVAEERVRSLLADLISTARAVETPQGSVIIPDDFHHGLIMLLHVAGHMVNNTGIGLRHLCDWAVYCSRVDIEKYKKELESIGLWVFACQLTSVCSKYLGLQHFNWSGQWSDEFMAALIEDILMAGNFGRKVVGADRVAPLRKRSFSSLTMARYPAAKKYTILLPFFMAVYIVRYLFLILIGKRKIIKLATLTRINGQKTLYEQFNLFDV